MPATRELAIPIPHEEIAAFCRKWGIKRLSFFGSIVRDDFDPARSDVGAERELSEIFDGRKVEMMTGVRHSVLPYVTPDIVVEYAEEI